MAFMKIQRKMNPLDEKEDKLISYILEKTNDA